MTAFHKVLVVAVASASATTAAEDALQQFHAKHRGLSTVSFSFRGNGLQGKLVAKRGGMYSIVVGDRTVVSDGETVWNASASNKTVVVNDYKPVSTDVSIERVFFDVMAVYRSSIASKSPSGIVVRLDAPSVPVQIAGISSVEITCTKSMVVTRVKIVSHGSPSEFTIENFRANPKVVPTKFTFPIPKGWQAVDIR